MANLDYGNRGISPLEHLVERGLLSVQDIVDGDVRVLNVSRRNLNFRVMSTTGFNYFVKQALTAERAHTIGHEAAIMREAALSPLFELLRPFLPTARDWDSESGTLVFDLIPNSLSLAAHHLKTNRWSEKLASQTGAVLATIQRMRCDRQLSSCELTVGDKLPWIISIHELALGVASSMSGAALEVVKIVQASDVICESLDYLRANWKESSIVHGDFKWDNIVVCEHPLRPRRRTVYIVDWEMVQLGDPLWDVASFLSQYLDAWIASIPFANNSSGPQAEAQTPLEMLQPAMIRFWSAYTRGVSLAGHELFQAIERTTRYAAVRLIQTAIEADQLSPRLSNTGILRLQVAENMLSRPLEAAATLLGIVAEVEAPDD